MRQTHELKILPTFFEPILNGDKTFEIRHNDDRGFQTMDGVVLSEYNPDSFLKNKWTGRRIRARISYVTNYAQKDGYVVFGLSNPREMEKGEPKPQAEEEPVDTEDHAETLGMLYSMKILFGATKDWLIECKWRAENGEPFTKEEIEELNDFFKRLDENMNEIWGDD